jgi:hypothetical protein
LCPTKAPPQIKRLGEENMVSEREKREINRRKPLARAERAERWVLPQYKTVAITRLDITTKFILYLEYKRKECKSKFTKV